jgi:predicted membrane protein DUF2306
LMGRRTGWTMAILERGNSHLMDQWLTARVPLVRTMTKTAAPKSTARFCLRVIVILLSLIAIASVLRRVGVLVDPTGPLMTAKSASFDRHFQQYRALTFAHIIPSLFFIALVPIQFIPAIRRRQRFLHIRLGWLLVSTGLVVGLTALALSFTNPIGGWIEASGTILYAIVFLISLALAVRHARAKHFALHREWMIRAYAVTLGVATTRPIVGLFFATTSLPPERFFGAAFWIGFSVTVFAGEIWIRYTRHT